MNRRDFLASPALLVAVKAARAAGSSSPQAATSANAAGGMQIDRSKCVACGNCVAVCPMGAICVDPAIKKATINPDECVECSTCLRSMPDVCPTAAFSLSDVAWPRSLRRVFSNPRSGHASTGIPGRGTEEVKTNDITNRIPFGYAGYAIEFGRPGIGVRFRDIQKVTTELARMRVSFEQANPVTYLLADTSTGRFKPELLDEKVLSAIVEIKTRLERVPAVLDLVKRQSPDVDTVISVGVATRCDPQGEDRALSALLIKHGYRYEHAKTNLGLGRATNPPKKGDRS